MARETTVRHEEEDFAPDDGDRRSGFVEIRTQPAPGKKTRGRRSLSEMIACTPDGPQLAVYILERLHSAEDQMERMLEQCPDKTLRLVLEQCPRFVRYAGERGERLTESEE